MLPKIVFDKIEFFKFKIINNFKQNIDETDFQYNQPYQHMDFKNLKKKIREPKGWDFCQIFVISNKKSIG